MIKKLCITLVVVKMLSPGAHPDKLEFLILDVTSGQRHLLSCTCAANCYGYIDTAWVKF